MNQFNKTGILSFAMLCKIPLLPHVPLILIRLLYRQILCGMVEVREELPKASPRRNHDGLQGADGSSPSLAERVV